MANCKQDKIDDTHAFLDTTGRFPLDRLLRDNGFLIWERKKGREAVWIKRLTGERHTFAETLATVSRKDVRAAEDEQESYLEARYG